MQYRGQIMPLIRLSRIIAGHEQESTSQSRKGGIQVVVYSEAGRSVGLVVDRIVDIVDDELSVQNPACRRGVLGSSVLQKKVTDLLDLPALVRDEIPGFAELSPTV